MFKHAFFIPLLSALLPFASLACALHFGESPDSTDLPGTMQIRFATMYYEQRNELTKLEEISPSARFQRIAWSLRLFERKLQQEGSKEIAGLNILLVDVPMWSAMQENGTIAIDIIEPNDSRNTLMLTEVTLNGLLKDELSLSQAFEYKLARLHQADSQTNEILRNLMP